jgi:hypothetical protein
VTLLIDLERVPACHCDSALEGLFKAMAQDPAGRPETIWAPVENPWIRATVEEVTAQLQHALEQVQNAIARLLTGEPIGELKKADDGSWGRWTESEFAAARLQLEAKRPEAYTLEDWLLAVDYLLQQFFPDGVIQSIADYLAVRSTLSGKIQAAMTARPVSPGNAPDPASVVELVPTRFRAVPPKVLTPVETQILRVAHARAAENISAVTQATRHRMKGLVIEHVQAQVLGLPDGQHQALRQRLFDEFGQMNRDFRRIAVTEAGECCNQGFIAALKPGRKVKRAEAYRGACDFCKSINGKVFTVVAADAPVKNGQTEVWVGKTNVGRSASPSRRSESGLVARSESEMWWPAAGVQHPHCRGSWVAVAEEDTKVDPAFASWMEELITKKAPRQAPPAEEDEFD